MYGEIVFSWIVSIIEHAGYLGIFVLMFAENVFPPIPSELIMPMGAMLAEDGEMSFPLVMLAGTLGSFLGQSLLFYLSRKFGPDRLKRWATDHGHWVAISVEEIDRAQEWFGKRRGNVAVFLGRLVPGIRSLISIPAGLAKMPVGSFLCWTLLGTMIWNGALLAAGRLIADNYEQVESYLDPITTGFVIVLVGSYLRRVVRSFRKGSAASGPSRSSSRQPRHA